MNPRPAPRPVTELTDIYGMRIIVRASLDVLIKDGVVENEFRVLRAIPTFQYLIKRGARVIILTHVGRDPENSTLPLIPALKKHIPVEHTSGLVGEVVYGKVAHMKEGSALLLENLRSIPGEESNNHEFARALASLGDFYVNDAFAVSHRAHASIVGIPKFLPNFAGITFMEEYEGLKRALTPEHPALFILGGAKFETKAPLIERYAEAYDTVALGGALANDFLKGRGFEVGASLVSDVDLSKNPLVHRENIIVPYDVVTEGPNGKRQIVVNEVAKDEKILDIGLGSVSALAPHITNAKTILWNGPLGYYEGGYDSATKECAKLIAESGAFSIVGGGDTVAAIESLGISEKFGFLSTAGGAMLEFLEKGTLPGIEALTAPRHHFI
jgi:phosphoglycerate kinase